METTKSNTPHQVVSVLCALALVIGLAALSGCNTFRGVGKDVKKVGETMERQ